MPKGRGFLVQRPLRRLIRVVVLHGLPKREFPCAPRYVFVPHIPITKARVFTAVWIKNEGITQLAEK